MAQVVCCPCANVSLQLAEGPDYAFHIQDDPRLHLQGHQATALPHSISVTHPHLTHILDPDHCRLKWLVCGNCHPPHVIYGVENDDEQALSHNLLLPLDHKLVLTQHVLVGADAEALPQKHKRYSPLYKVVVPTSRSFGPEVPGTELTPDLRVVLTQLDATYAAHVAKETAAMEARIAQFRDAEVAKLKALDAHVAEERDCLFAAAVRLRRGVILPDDNNHNTSDAGCAPTPTSSSRSAVASNGNRPGLLPSSLGAACASANATPDPSRPATAATAMNPTLDVQLSASFRPTTLTVAATTDSELAHPPAAANRPRQRTLTGGMPTASASAHATTADGDLFLFDDDGDDQAPPPPPKSPELDTETAASAMSDMESDVDDSPTTKFGTSLPMSIPPAHTPTALRSRQPTTDAPTTTTTTLLIAPAPAAPIPHTPLPTGSPPGALGAVPVGDGTSDEDLGDVDNVGHALPPHAYLARTYAAPPGVLVVGSKPAGAGERGFSFRG